MIGRTNAFSGGGGGCSDSDAMVRVIAPAGSTVTFSRGAVTKSSTGHQNADDASVYDYYFIVPASAFSSSPWTVTATLGADTETQTIVVDSAYEYDLIVNYATYILRNGVLQTGYTINAMNDSGVTAPTITSESGYLNIKLPSKSGFYFSQITFSDYSTLYVDSGITNGSNYSWSLLGVSSYNAWVDSATYLNPYHNFSSSYSRSTVSLDLSTVQYKILKWSAQATNSTGFDLNLYNIYLK